MNEEDNAPESSKGGSNEKIERTSNKRKRDDTEDKHAGTAKRCCARCRNHESDDIELKGHKNYCPWRDCICEPCIRTVVRQKLMADQTASRRKRHEMERRQEAGLPIIVPTVSQLKRLKTVADCGVVSFTPRSKPVVSSPGSGGASNLPKLICDVPEPKEVSWEAITELMNFFNFNVNTSALLYLILKYTSNNVKAACSIILNGYIQEAVT